MNATDGAKLVAEVWADLQVDGHRKAKKNPSHQPIQREWDDGRKWKETRQSVTSLQSVVADDAHKEIIQDLPGKTDFDRYLSALEMAVDFCIRHKYYVDLNLQFGLFLINVTRLFYNVTTWAKPVDTFNLDLLNQTTINSPEQLKKMYGRWEDYYNSVNNYENNSPTPAESDACIAYLVRSSSVRLNRRSKPNCLTPPRCKQILQKGSEFGYGLTHRLLYLIMARFSRRCVVFSKKEDKFTADMLCKKCFSEAEFIASNSFQLPDLIYEHIALCGIFGHAQFIRNYWLKTLLHFQINEGCFSQKIVTGDFDEIQLRDVANQTWEIERSSSIMNGQCNGHFTAVAAGVFSHALRYIIETHY